MQTIFLHALKVQILLSLIFFHHHHHHQSHSHNATGNRRWEERKSKYVIMASENETNDLLLGNCVCVCEREREREREREITITITSHILSSPFSRGRKLGSHTTVILYLLYTSSLHKSQNNHVIQPSFSVLLFT